MVPILLVNEIIYWYSMVPMILLTRILWDSSGAVFRSPEQNTATKDVEKD